MEQSSQTTKRMVSETNNRRGRRGRIEIAAAMLDAAGDGAGKTRIMQNANLSYDLLLKYLSFLTETGLLERIGNNGVYHITSKGARFLKEFKELQVLNNLYMQKLHALTVLVDRKPYPHQYDPAYNFFTPLERKKLIPP